MLVWNIDLRKISIYARRTRATSINSFSQFELFVLSLLSEPLCRVAVRSSHTSARGYGQVFFYNKKLKNYTSALILDSSDIDTS